MNKRYYIYKHIRPDTNEVFYVGIGNQSSKRAWETRKHNDHWYHIVNKNNGNYIVELLFKNLTHEEACQKEIELIKFYGRKIDGGTLCNYQLGGKDKSGYIMTDEKKELLSRLLKDNKRALGYKHSEESKRKMSESRKGKSTLKKGQKDSEETKYKKSQAHKGNISNTNKIWINNGVISTLIQKELEIPFGWTKGRISWKTNK